MEVLRATASECTCDLAPNQEATTQIHRPPVGTSADASNGHATFRNLSRYSSYHERTFARWYGRPFDFVALNKAAITQVIPPDHQQALVIDASFIPKSGTHTYGLERFWNSRQRRSEKGLEVSAVAWLDITDRCAYGLSVEQTPPSNKTSEPQGTRIDAYLEQLQRVVCDHHLGHLRYVIADGYYSKRKFLDGVRALGMHQIGKLRRERQSALSLPRTGALGTRATQDL